ncbi:hypothetical protein Poly30_05540 [Planctomycetes bacterium Poly30]|uniref:Uncharacterized protein n=1 Tax=Saltatorellus ferox TaxID=2528018 RepID=A0A518ELU1_9BACT|nr:hypothetical protein Poly30_05540 [Planctomycetes bacterium Poly30]
MNHRFFSLLAPALALPALASAQTTFIVNTTTDTVDANPGDGMAQDALGATSLRAAVQEANATADQVTIILQSNALYQLTLLGAGEEFAATGDLDFRGNIVVEGNGATIDGMGADRVIDSPYRYRTRIRNVKLTGGAVVSENGGAARNGGLLALDGCEIFDCSATGAGASGGGASNTGGLLWVRGTTIRNCTATRAGGGIECNEGITNVSDSLLLDNMTGPMPGNGGGLHLTGAGKVIFESTEMRGNSASSEGGGAWNSSTGIMSFSFCEAIGNEALGTDATNGGGGLFNDGGSMTVDLCDIRENTATEGSGSGGGLFNNAGTLAVSLTRVRDNDSNRAGGGIEIVEGMTLISTSIFERNMTGASPGNGGGLHLSGAGEVTVQLSEFRDNVATAEGGGLWNSGVGTMTISDTLVSGNIASGNDADQGGGGLFNDGGAMFVMRGLVANNSAVGTAGSGGGILNNGGTLNVDSTRLTFNDSNRAGGGIESNVGDTILRRVALTNNSTGSSPGNGGGFHLTGAGTVTIDRSAILTNSAANEGGGLWNSATGVMTVTLSAITGNNSPVGADNFNDGGTFTIDGVPVP